MAKRQKLPHPSQRRLADFPVPVSLPSRFVKDQAVCLTRDKTTNIPVLVNEFMRTEHLIIPVNTVGKYVRTSDQHVVYGHECIQHLIYFALEHFTGWIFCDDDELSEAVETGQTDGS